MRPHRISKKQVRDVALEAYNAQLREAYDRDHERRQAPHGLGRGPHLIQHRELPPEMKVLVDTLVGAFNRANGYNGKTTGSG